MVPLTGGFNLQGLTTLKLLPKGPYIYFNTKMKLFMDRKLKKKTYSNRTLKYNLEILRLCSLDFTNKKVNQIILSYKKNYLIKIAKRSTRL